MNSELIELQLLNQLSILQHNIALMLRKRMFYNSQIDND